MTDFADIDDDGLLDITVAAETGTLSMGNVVLEVFYNDEKVTDPDPNPVPEPATLLLLGSGLAGLVFYRRKRG